MADEQVVDQVPEVEAEARRLGWVEKDKFRGNEADWMDATSYVERGRQMLPILRANNRKLEEKTQTLEQRVMAAESALAESKETIAALKEFTTEAAKRAAEESRKELVAQLKAARESGDVEQEAKVFEQLGIHTAAQAAAVAKPVVKEPPKPQTEEFTPTPEFKAFMEAHPWYNENAKMRAVATINAQEMAAAGKFDGISPADRLAMVAEATLKEFGMQTSRRSNVEGGSRGAARTGDGPGEGQSYNDLPAEAKAACAKQAKAVVGENRAFKTEADWRKHYAELYFRPWGRNALQ